MPPSMTEPAASDLVILATGDVAPRRGDLGSMFTGVATALSRGDLVFGQLEAALTDRGAPVPHVRLAMRTEPAAAAAIRAAGYGVMSFAGNHALDYGREGLFDTLEHASAAGLVVCGAGATLAEARQPASLEAKGLRVAVLAYSSILPEGYAASNDRPGVAPMRALTHFEQVETDQPGTPSRLHTFAHRADLAALEDDVRKARAHHDLVFVSLHWGIHFVPEEIADYQREVARAAVRAGAAAVLGHHPHILKGIEVIDGAPVFYSLGNFAIEQPGAFLTDLTSTRGFAEISRLNPDFDASRRFVPPKDTQMSLIARLVVREGRIAETRFLPVMINDDAEPRVLTASEPDFAKVTDYVAAISVSQGLGTSFRVEGDEVLCLASTGQ